MGIQCGRFPSTVRRMFWAENRQFHMPNIVFQDFQRPWWLVDVNFGLQITPQEEVWRGRTIAKAKEPIIYRGSVCVSCGTVLLVPTGVHSVSSQNWHRKTKSVITLPSPLTVICSSVVLEEERSKDPYRIASVFLLKIYFFYIVNTFVTIFVYLAKQRKNNLHYNTIFFFIFFADRVLPCHHQIQCSNN